MEIALRYCNPLPRFRFWLKEAMWTRVWKVCEAPAKKIYSTSGKTTMEKRLYRLPEAAVYLGIPEKSLYKMTWQKRLPFAFKVGRLLRFDKQKMDDWVEQNIQQTE